MIKINLLPPNIFEARAIKRVIILFAVILVAVVAISMVAKSKIDAAATTFKQEADDAAILKQQADGLASQASNLRAQIAPIQSKIAFFEAVKIHNEEYPKLYEDLARFTYKKVIYSSLQPDGSSLSITAFAPSLKDAGRYLLNVYRATHLFTSVTISGVPGYPYTGSAGTTSGGGMGMPPGIGAMPPMPQSMPGPTNASFGQQSSLSRTPEAGVPSLSGGSVTGFMAPGASESFEGTPRGYGGYGGIEAITSGVGRAEVKRQTGFQFTVTCRLAKPIMAPAAPGMGTGQAMPGMGGMPGGLPTPGGLPSAMSPGPPAQSGSMP